AACAWIDQRGAPIVVKADGLAAGKGVVVAPDVATAKQAVHDILGLDGARVVIEECLLGEEASFIVVADGNFHGRTTTIVAFSTDEDAREGYGPYTPGF
ncbi:phosphoribosylamine--glycine ligase, partial [Enterococcus hirae]